MRDEHKGTEGSEGPTSWPGSLCARKPSPPSLSILPQPSQQMKRNDALGGGSITTAAHIAQLPILYPTFYL